MNELMFSRIATQGLEPTRETLRARVVHLHTLHLGVAIAHVEVQSTGS
jgi:hypothetical protein